MEATSRGCTHIATDSLSTLYQVKKVVHQPQDMNEHRHLLLHKRIAQLILQRGQPIHISKVKSHIGIVGNEISDELATSVAKGTENLTYMLRI
jgi:ribonuclease HI